MTFLRAVVVGRVSHLVLLYFFLKPTPTYPKARDEAMQNMSEQSSRTLQLISVLCIHPEF